MIELFEKVLNEYLREKELPLKDNKLAIMVRTTLQRMVEQEIRKSKYTVKGSFGQGQWAEIPWVCVFNDELGKSATKGIYIAILFKADMSGFYITLNQGWTFFDQKYKPTSLAKEKIKVTASLLSSKVDCLNFDVSEIDLASKNKLAIGYELGTVCSKYYDANHLPTNEDFKDDLLKFVSILDQVEAIKGPHRNFNDFYTELLLNQDGLYYETNDDEIGYVDSANRAETTAVIQNVIENNEEVPILKKDPVIDMKGRRRWPRSSIVAAEALNRSSHQCEVDMNHQTFISKASGENFMEAHHLIPMNKQADFKYSLDRVANVKSLCPNCHRAIHYGDSTVRNEIIEKLYWQSIDSLKNVGLTVSLDDLIDMY